jgi:hypothetical protein
MGRGFVPGSGLRERRGTETIGSMASHPVSIIENAGCMKLSVSPWTPSAISRSPFAFGTKALWKTK